jgi:hypothetical protein
MAARWPARSAPTTEASRARQRGFLRADQLRIRNYDDRSQAGCQADPLRQCPVESHRVISGGQPYGGDAVQQCAVAAEQDVARVDGIS